MIADLREAARYLGYGSNLPDDRTMEEMLEITDELEASAKGKWIYGSYDLEISEDCITLSGTGIELRGRNIRRILANAKTAYIMACTIGPQAERIIQLKKLQSATSGMIADACASALVEGYADLCQKEIEGNLKPNQTLTFRFAPGYGDLPLATNKMILEELKAEKRIGIHLTETMLMTPRKSIVAILGILDGEANKGNDHYCGNESCDDCSLKDDCASRRQGSANDE